MRINNRIWMVASGSAGVGMTNSFDCNAYLVDCSGGFVLIDCGAGLEPERVRAAIAETGFAPLDCRGILLTHAHADHAGGASWLRAYTGAEVYALPECVRYLSSGDSSAISLGDAIRAGVYPPDYRFSPCPATYLQDGKALCLGDLAFQAISTPGHSSGHCAFLVELDGVHTLFSGDAIFPGGRISLQPVWDCSVHAYAETIAKLMEIPFDALIPSHHGLLLSGGKEAVRLAHKRFQALAVPPNAG